MDMTTVQAGVLLILSLPVALFVAWSDMKYMRIANRTVLLLLGIFVVAGIFLFPFENFLWRLGQFAVVLLIGFVLNSLGLVGGGDAKYAAAMAPFFSPGDLRLVVLLFAGTMLAAFLTHRLARVIPPIRRVTADWASWSSGNQFPMGLALSGTLILYLLIAIFLP